MNQLSKKAIASILSLVLVFVALGATTFAWFTLGTTATVGNFDLTARGSEGLEIQLLVKDESDPSVYKPHNGEWLSTVNTEKMNEYIQRIFVTKDTDGTNKPSKLDAITTVNGRVFNTFGGVTEIGDTKEGEVNTEGIATANKEFLELTFKFRTLQKNSYINLNDLNLNSQVKADWVPDVNYMNENGKNVGPDVKDLKGDLKFPKLTLNAHYAARVSFTNENDKTVIFQEAQTEVEVGSEHIMRNINGYGFDTSNNQIGAHNYLAVKHGLTSIKTPETESDLANRLNSDLVFVAATSKQKKLVEINTDERIDGKDYQVATITVRVWLEGWDANTYDAIFDQMLHIGFAFDLKENITETP